MNRSSVVKLRYAARATNDFEALFHYCAKHWGSDAAHDYLASFDTTLDLITRYPRCGRARFRLGKALRSIRHRSHVIYYRPFATDVLIVRVLHTAMDASDAPPTQSTTVRPSGGFRVSG